MNIYLMENKSTMPYPTTDGRQQESASTTVAHSFYNPTTIYMKCQWSRPKKLIRLRYPTHQKHHQIVLN